MAISFVEIKQHGWLPLTNMQRENQTDTRLLVNRRRRINNRRRVDNGWLGFKMGAVPVTMRMPFVIVPVAVSGMSMVTAALCLSSAMLFVRMDGHRHHQRDDKNRTADNFLVPAFAGHA
jgi:hypothetical protein